MLVDGRSGAGMSSFAVAAARARGAGVVATDDIAWHLHPTDWATEMLEGVVRPSLDGEHRARHHPGRTRAEAEQFRDEWMAAEQSFLEVEQPWRVADLVVDGTSDRGTDVERFVHLTEDPRGVHS